MCPLLTWPLRWEPWHFKYGQAWEAPTDELYLSLRSLRVRDDTTVVTFVIGVAMCW